MAAVPEDMFPRARIPSVKVNISKQYILLQALEALGISSCQVTTDDFLSGDIIADVSVDIPPHGDIFSNEKKTFYGEPSKIRAATIESAHAAALSYLQNEDIIFVDDANLQALKKRRYELLRATSFSDAFESQCISQQTEIAAMNDYIQLIIQEAPLSPPTDDEIIQNNMAQNVPLVHQENGFALHPVLLDIPPPDVQPIIDKFIPADHSTPPRNTILSEDLLSAMPGTSATVKTDASSGSDDNSLPHGFARRELRFN